MPFADAEKARTYQREYRRTRRSGDPCTTPGTSPIPVAFRLQTAQDVIDLLQEQVALVRAAEEAGALDKARCCSWWGRGTTRWGTPGGWVARPESPRACRKHRDGWARFCDAEQPDPTVCVLARATTEAAALKNP